MLNHLHIQNFAIVPTLDLDIQPGFTAITGETGAGKSILVDALGLLLGERSDAAWVRAGTERAELTAGFSVDNNREARRWLEESDLSSDDGCLLRRTINNSGRSRAWINGSPATLSQIQSIGRLLVEIHGQNEHLRLNKRPEQFRLLDGSGRYSKNIARVRNAFAQWQRVADELDALEKDHSVSDNELEFLSYQLAELQQHDLSIGSINALQSEHDRLAAGDALLNTLTLSIEQLDPESSLDHTGTNSDLNRTLGQLKKFESLDADIDDACTMLHEAAVNCSEAVNSLRVARDRLELNPARYEELSKTLDSLHDLARKHKVQMEGLEPFMQTLAERIDRAGSSEQRRTDLKIELQNRLEDYRSACQDLHNMRSEHAAEISRNVTGLMSDLGMAGGLFEMLVSLNPQAKPSPRGDDDIQIRISANPGLPPGPLNKIASGGELSRISLAIKVAASSGSESVTQIFDEVDAGIGGETANAVGKLMKRLAGDGQALCVTHLAQVAVCASHQLQVRKATGKDSTEVDTRLLDKGARVEEIARMLSGKLSEKSRAHAIELLNAGLSA